MIAIGADDSAAQGECVVDIGAGGRMTACRQSLLDLKIFLVGDQALMLPLA
ncbi:MAG: hypothetical protein AAFY13_03260 [Pseudomonadota bacterium]